MPHQYVLDRVQIRSAPIPDILYLVPEFFDIILHEADRLRIQLPESGIGGRGICREEISEFLLRIMWCSLGRAVILLVGRVREGGDGLKAPILNTARITEGGTKDSNETSNDLISHGRQKFKC